MLDQISTSSDTILRLRRGALRPHLDDFATALADRGLAVATIRDYVRGAAHFGLWLDRRSLAVPQLLDRHVAQFLEDHRRQCLCPVARKGSAQHHGAGLRALLVTLRGQGVLGPEPLPARPAWAPLVDEYADYLTETRGLTPKTRSVYSSCAAALLSAKFGHAPADLSHLRVVDLAAQVLSRGQTCSMREARQTATALRSFTRYLHVIGLCGPELALGVPSPSVRGPSKAPEVLDDDQVSALVAAFNRRSAMGQRGYAMTMCLVALGLRSCEVADITLDDIDWRGATIRIARGKGRRASTLPLPKKVGEALVEYIAGGRPTAASRHVFVRHVVPRGEPIAASAVRIAIRRAFERAGVDVPSKGTHILRRTAATRMMRGGASIKEVADILRHRSVDTTVLYARMDLHALAEVAMPWPEVRS